MKRNQISVLPWVENWITHQKKTSRRIVANRLAKSIATYVDEEKKLRTNPAIAREV